MSGGSFIYGWQLSEHPMTLLSVILGGLNFKVSLCYQESFSFCFRKLYKFCKTTLTLKSNFSLFLSFQQGKKRSMGEREKVLPWKRPHLPPPLPQTSIFWPKISISKRWLEAAQLISPETVYWVKTGGIPTEREKTTVGLETDLFSFSQMQNTTMGVFGKEY